LGRSSLDFKLLAGPPPTAAICRPWPPLAATCRHWPPLAATSRKTGCNHWCLPLTCTHVHCPSGHPAPIPFPPSIPHLVALGPGGALPQRRFMSVLHRPLLPCSPPPEVTANHPPHISTAIVPRRPEQFVLSPEQLVAQGMGALGPSMADVCDNSARMALNQSAEDQRTVPPCSVSQDHINKKNCSGTASLVFDPFHGARHTDAPAARPVPQPLPGRLFQPPIPGPHHRPHHGGVRVCLRATAWTATGPLGPREATVSGQKIHPAARAADWQNGPLSCAFRA
jgi:hypothetical protein